MELPSAKNRRLIILALLATAAALFAIAVVVYRGNPSSADLPIAIQSISPEAGSNVLSQSDVSVDLARGYTAVLEINGFEIPEDQLRRVEGLNQISYQPRQGNIVPSLRADQNCVRVTYWLIAQGPQDSSRYDWCFDAS